VGPFDFWAAGIDNGVPEDSHWRVGPGLLLTLVGLVLFVVLVAVFVPRG
jgi:uncharacterized YccA/Bax inhibitor family protein